MTSILKKISDYDRLASELQEKEKALSEAQRKLGEITSELEKVRGQLQSALEKAREERRRRAEEESRRGRAEKECAEKAKQVEDLSRKLAELEARASRPEVFAVLSKEQDLSPERVADFVRGIELLPGEECLSALVTEASCEAFLDSVPGMGAWARRLRRGARGLVAFVSERRACVLEPPLPVQADERRVGEAFDLSLIEPLMEKPLVGFVSVHRDAYAVCLFDGQVRDLVLEEEDVVGKSKKGGSSQARFARSREDQVKHLLLEANEAAARLLSGGEPAYLLLEGDERTVSAFLEASATARDHRIIRYALPGKLTRNLLASLPGLFWRWRGWVFDLPLPVAQPRG
ncbi:MAG: hypothetical protein JTT11_09170 [Candidatus Brockarchaeota archaeon]|nr:hypothetical protein [Candidatus Brockarchaeota archaeon]